jgi:hypothetical protein
MNGEPTRAGPGETMGKTCKLEGAKPGLTARLISSCAELTYAHLVALQNPWPNRSYLHMNSAKSLATPSIFSLYKVGE